jgi:DNA-binding response OmpR family regulator
MRTSAKTLKSRALSTRGGVKHILLVEDDADLAVLLKDYLESYFYRVTTVTNGVDGLNAILDVDFDVILCDVVMPKMPGDMFYHAVQRVQPQLCERFIFITAHRESPRVAEFLNQVSEMVLMKPFHLDDLLEVILLLFRELESTTNKLAETQESLTPAPIPPQMKVRSRLSA